MSKKILVVDDNKTFLEVAEGYLRGMGHKVVTVDNGEEALKLASAKHPDIILLDVVMPGKSGFQVCRELKSNEKTKKIKVIIISGNIPEIEKGFDYGADDCIMKPLEWDKLSEKLKEY